MASGKWPDLFTVVVDSDDLFKPMIIDILKYSE